MHAVSATEFARNFSVMLDQVDRIHVHEKIYDAFATAFLQTRPRQPAYDG